MLSGIPAFGILFSARRLRSDPDCHGRYGQHHEIHLLQENQNTASGFYPRTAINADGAQTPLATMVRVYQLRDRKAVDAADYQTLLRNADTILKDDVLASKSLLVMPKVA